MVRTSRTNKVCCSRSCRTYKVKHTTSACNRKITPSVYRKERCRVTISFMQSANFCHVRGFPAEPPAAGPANQSGPGGPAARRPGRGDPRSSRPLPPAGSPPRGAGRRQWVARWLFLALRAGVPCRQRFRLRAARRRRVRHQRAWRRILASLQCPPHLPQGDVLDLADAFAAHPALLPRLIERAEGFKPRGRLGVSVFSVESAGFFGPRVPARVRPAPRAG